jgi:hypothetical protein
MSEVDAMSAHADIEAIVPEALVEAIAERVVDKLLERVGTGPASVDAAEVARRLGLSRDYVYKHADELGAMRTGTGKRARLRFDLDRVQQSMQERDNGQSKISRRRRPSAELLEIRGDRRAA